MDCFCFGFEGPPLPPPAPSLLIFSGTEAEEAPGGTVIADGGTGIDIAEASAAAFSPAALALDNRDFDGPRSGARGGGCLRKEAEGEDAVVAVVVTVSMKMRLGPRLGTPSHPLCPSRNEGRRH